MKKYILLMLVFFSDSSMAMVYHYNIQGAISDQRFDSLPAEGDPYPNLLNGTFSGSFSIDSSQNYFADYSLSTNYKFYSVSIDMIDINGNVVHTLSSGQEYRVEKGGGIGFIFGYSAPPESVLKPNDLRLWFDGSIINSYSPPLVDDMLALTFREGFVETDGISNGTWWDTWVSSSQITFSHTSPSTVPIPSSGLLLSSALLVFYSSKNRRR